MDLQVNWMMVCRILPQAHGELLKSHSPRRNIENIASKDHRNFRLFFSSTVSFNDAF